MSSDSIINLPTYDSKEKLFNLAIVELATVWIETDVVSNIENISNLAVWWKIQ